VAFGANHCERHPHPPPQLITSHPGGALEAMVSGDITRFCQVRSGGFVIGAGARWLELGGRQGAALHADCGRARWGVAIFWAGHVGAAVCLGGWWIAGTKRQFCL